MLKFIIQGYQLYQLEKFNSSYFVEMTDKTNLSGQPLLVSLPQSTTVAFLSECHDTSEKSGEVRRSSGQMTPGIVQIVRNTNKPPRSLTSWVSLGQKPVIPDSGQGPSEPHYPGTEVTLTMDPLGAVPDIWWWLLPTLPTCLLYLILMLEKTNQIKARF